MQNSIGKLVVLPALLIGLPLGGMWLTGEPVAPYLKFPPVTSYIEHAPFSWPVFLFLALLVISLCGPVFLRIIRTKQEKQVSQARSRRLPWWGMVGIAVVSVFWLLSWSRFPWFAALQAYTFFPLWFGYIITVNSLTFQCSGQCLLLRDPRFFLALFPLSALFWWFFEYLNRFSRNWHYLGVEDFSALGYVAHATLCFSTVLPAVLSTEEYLTTFPRLSESLKEFWTVRIKNPYPIGWATLIPAGLGLAGIGAWPDYLFPLLWVAPFLIIISMQAISGEETIFAPLKCGDWRPIWLPALAALICGFFWEMWNIKSMAHWEYSVPFVQRFHLFEMPVLGYAGYLPFGLECMVVAGLIRFAARS